MASPELEWVKQQIANNRAKAGVSTEFFDLRVARASMPPTELPMPEGTLVEYCLADKATCYWVCAPESSPNRRIVYFHGGGFVNCGFHSHRNLAGWLSHYTQSAVLFVEYRLAPEFRFPIGVEDCYQGYLHALEQGPSRSRSVPTSIFVAGDSSGGALAAATVLNAQRENKRIPDGCVIICGMLDLDEKTSKFLQMTQWTRDDVRLYVHYLEDLKNPLASPMLANLTGFPPLLIQTGTEDYCADDNIRFAEKARAAGVGTTFENWPAMIHVWQRFAPKLPEATQSLERIAEWIKSIEADSIPKLADKG
jgi:monoterpene epsilon-lactone hydrolase